MYLLKTYINKYEKIGILFIGQKSDLKNSRK